MLVRMLRLARLARAVRLMVPWPLPNNFLCRMKFEQPVNWTQKRNITGTVFFLEISQLQQFPSKIAHVFASSTGWVGQILAFWLFMPLKWNLTPLLQYSGFVGAMELHWFFPRCSLRPCGSWSRDFFTASGSQSFVAFFLGQLPNAPDNNALALFLTFVSFWWDEFSKGTCFLVHRKQGKMLIECWNVPGKRG